MKKLAPIAFLMAMTGMASLTACSQPAEQSSTATKSEDTQTTDSKSNDDSNANATKELMVVTPWEVSTFDPSKSGFIFQRIGLTETLVDADGQGTLKPALATKWTTNAEGTEWTFTLRDDVTFHDGTSLTANNVVKSITVALTKPTALEKANVKNITAIDEHTVKFTLDKPLFSFPAYLAHATTAILADASFSGEAGKEEVTNIVATGAYQLETLEPPQKVTEKAYANYWGEKAKIQNVTYLANSRSETRTLLAQSEPNYLVYTLDKASLGKLEQDPNLNVMSKALTRTILLKVNNTNPMFAKADVRRALSDAIDRKGLAITVMNSEDTIAEQILPKAFGDWMVSAEYKKPDYPAIKQRLIDAGFTQGEDGMLSLDSKPFKFTIRTFSDRPELPLIGTALQDQWKKIGADVAVSVGNFSEIPAGHQDGTLEVALFARNYGLVPDPIGTLATDFAPEGADWGVMNWNNDTVTQALETLNSTDSSADPVKAKELKQQISQVIYDERPLIPVLYYQQNAAAHKDLKGLEIDGLERNFRLNKLSW